MDRPIQVFGTRHTGVDETLECLRADPVWGRMDSVFSEAGFRCWSYSAAPVCPAPTTSTVRVTTYPRGHVKECIEHKLFSPCPGLSFAFHHRQPALFKTVRARTPMSRPFAALLKLNREFRVTRGVVVPLHGVFGVTGMLALEFEGTDGSLLNTWRDERDRLLGEIAQFNHGILAHHARCFTRDALPDLTSRQREIVRLLAQGLTTQEVSDVLHISIDTVNKHTASIKRQLGTRTTAQTTALAARWGLI